MKISSNKFVYAAVLLEHNLIISILNEPLNNFHKEEEKSWSNECNQNPIGACSEAEGLSTTANGTTSHTDEEGTFE